DEFGDVDVVAPDLVAPLARARDGGGGQHRYDQDALLHARVRRARSGPRARGRILRETGGPRACLRRPIPGANGPRPPFPDRSPLRRTYGRIAIGAGPVRIGHGPAADLAVGLPCPAHRQNASASHQSTPLTGRCSTGRGTLARAGTASPQPRDRRTAPGGAR